VTITPLLHRLAARSRVYDAIQFVTGGPVVAGIMRRWLAGARGIVVDVGGGTGRLKTLLPSNARHVCVDVDGLKLSGYAAKFDDALAIHGEASMLPFRSGAVEAITFVAVSHHLSDEQLTRVLDEIARVQSSRGTFFFFDAIQVPDRFVSRLLWRHDRGAYPRTKEQLVAVLHRHFRVVDCFEHTIVHRYVACRCERL
jgi:ubiquinone/menaquinone biosynthesis C-methylase UbiE